MKRFFTCLGTAMLFAGVITSATSERVELKDGVLLMPPSTKTKSIFALTSTSQKVLPLKSPVMKSSMDRKSVLLYEDFSNVPDGNTETIENIGERYIDALAFSEYGTGDYISNEYTPESGTWYGNLVYAGKGGSVILQSISPVSDAVLATPLADYSGDLTVTMKLRASKIFWPTEDGYRTGNGSNLKLRAIIGGYNNYEAALTDMESMGQMLTGQVYELDGWQEVTFKFHNESANNNGYLYLGTSDAIEIDWIKITDDNTFLACPVIDPITNFTDTGFTINWQPVRRSFNYYIDLYRQVYTADNGVDVTYDFNDGQLPEGTIADESQLIAGEGINGSTALMLGYDGEGAAFQTPIFDIKLKTFTSKLKFEINDEDNIGAKINYDVFGENGWEPLGYVKYDGFMTVGGYYFDVSLQGSQFEDKYYAVRFYTEGLSPENHVYIDDITAWSPRPFVLERVFDEEKSSCWDPENDDYAYNYYDHTENQHQVCSYTFENLDPNTEYWYRVRSHNVNEFSIGDKLHAFGVQAPTLLPATNVGNGSYTVNWKDVPKAQSYNVINYGVTKVEHDDNEYVLMAETFSNCDGSSDIEIMTPVEGNVNEITDLSGWSGSHLQYGYHMLGGLGWGSYVDTPPLMVNPNRGSYYIYIEAQGYPGDYLYIKALNCGIDGYIPFDEDGYISGWFEIPTPVPGEKIRILSINYVPFGICAFELVQPVEAGDMVRAYHSDVIVPAGVQNYTFSNLNDDGLYGYDVVSRFDLEKESVTSDSDKWMWVDLATGNSAFMTKIDLVNTDVTEVARYTIDGRKVTEDYKGIVIVKMSDGSVKKKVVR